MRAGVWLGVCGVVCALSWFPTGAWAQPEPVEEEPAAEEPPPGEEPAPEPAPTEPAPAEPAPAEPAPTEPAPAEPVPTEPAPAPAAAPAPEIDPELAALFPAGVLEQIPPAMTRYIRLADMKALREACPQPDAAGVLACVEGDAVADKLASAYLRGVASAMVEHMDAGMPARLTDADLDALGERCKDTIAPWAVCTIDKGPDDPACAGPEDALAFCVADDDAVNVAYLALQDDKKAAWGDPESYVELRGLLALFTVEEVSAIRKDCPMSDATLVECLEKQPLAGQGVQAFLGIAKGLTEEAAAELGKSGKELSQDDAAKLMERVLTLFLTFPARAVASIATACEKQNPDLAELSDPAEIDRMLSCIEAESGADPVANPAFISQDKLRGWLAKGRAKVETAVRAKEEAAQGRSFDIILMVLGGIAGLGAVVILLMPLVLRRKYPQAQGLWAGSAVAAGVFVGTMAILGGALLVMRTVQGKIGTDSTSPKMRVTDAVFSVLERDEYVEDFSDISKLRLDLIKTPLRQLQSDVAAVIADAKAAGASDAEAAQAVAAVLAEHWGRLLEQPEIKRIAKNVALLKEHVATYKSAIALLKSLDGVLGYVPLVLALLAVLMYLLPMRQTLVDIATAPARRASGGEGGMRAALRSVLSEVKVVGPYLLLILVLLPLTGLFIAFAVEPVMEIVIRVALLNFIYILGADASGFAIQGSLIGAMLLLVFTVLVYILAIAFYAGSFRKIMRAHFHEGRRLAEFKRFWTWGTLGLVAVLAFPVVFAQLARMGQTMILDKESDALTGTDLWLVPLVAAALFFVVFWAVRGFKALGALKLPKAATSAPQT
ncbi:MAG: hypothetical protein IT385_27805 [Deltaproteobacteria bacterium]|nr:hypothetical protein [Deltaproteobacteria bacterium]